MPLLCAMSSVKTRRYVLRSQFCGPAKREDLELVEEELPPLKDGGKDRHRGECEVALHGREWSGCYTISITKTLFLCTKHLEFLCEAQWLSVDPYMR